MARALFKAIMLVKIEAESNSILPHFTLSSRLQVLMHDSEEYILLQYYVWEENVSYENILIQIPHD